MNRKYIKNITSSTVENPEWRPQTASLTLLYKIHYNIVAIDPAVYLTPWSFKKLHAHTYASQLLCSQTTQTSSNSLQAAPSFTNSPSSPGLSQCGTPSMGGIVLTAPSVIDPVSVLTLSVKILTLSVIMSKFQKRNTAPQYTGSNPNKTRRPFLISTFFFRAFLLVFVLESQ